MTRAVLFILRWVAPKILNLLLTVTIVLGGIYYTQYKVEHMVNNVQTKIENKIDNTIRNIKNTVIKVVDSEKIKEARRSVSVAEKEINKAIILIKEINDIINTEYKDASIEEKIGRALGLLDIASEIGDENLIINLNDAISPVLIQDKSDNHSYYVIMPMKI